MSTLARFAATVSLVVLLFAPLSASAALFSFGGRVLTVTPCSSGLHVTIFPAGVFPVSYIWTPVTITFSAGPPNHPGQQILGLYDIPYVCFVGTVPLFGFRMFLVGTSLI